MMISIFSKTKKSLGWLVLELQTDGICVLHLTTGNPPQVQFALFYPLTQDDIPVVLLRINKALQLNHYHCSHLLSQNDYQISLIETPNVPREELKTAVRWLLKDMLDYHVDDATIDVLDIPIDKSMNTRKAMMYVISARDQLIAQRQAWFNSAKIPVTVIDIPELAQRNIANLITPAGRGIALLSLNSSGCLLTISYQDELYLSRRLDIQLTQLDTLPSEQKQFILDKVSLELQRTFDHIDRQYNFISLAKLVVTPPVAEGAELMAYLSANLHIPAESLDLSTLFDFSLSPELQAPAQQMRFQMCLGAALRDEGKTP
ncbi:MAG: agglutinin biogenesis protein MshI [Betaproteobacteria bacterium]|nr:agglutinin biogenesis protein MshI [Betaproteobacteria bacterium]